MTPENCQRRCNCLLLLDAYVQLEQPSQFQTAENAPLLQVQFKPQLDFAYIRLETIITYLANTNTMAVADL